MTAIRKSRPLKPADNSRYPRCHAVRSYLLQQLRGTFAFAAPHGVRIAFGKLTTFRSCRTKMDCRYDISLDVQIILSKPGFDNLFLNRRPLVTKIIDQAVHAVLTSRDAERLRGITSCISRHSRTNGMECRGRDGSTVRHGPSVSSVSRPASSLPPHIRPVSELLCTAVILPWPN